MPGSLTAAQATVLRWILIHPGASPFARDATAAMDLNAGTVNSATKALMEAELIELFARNRSLHGNHTAEAARHPVTGGVGRGIVAREYPLHCHGTASRWRGGVMNPRSHSLTASSRLDLLLHALRELPPCGAVWQPIHERMCRALERRQV